MDLTAKTGKLGFEFPLRKGAADNEKNAKASKKKAAKKKVAKKKTAKSKPVKKP